MNPLSLPVGIAVRVMGDLAAIAAAARAFVELDLRQMQEDVHVLAEVAARLPDIESELTRRMDEMEDTAEHGVAELKRATRAAEKLIDAIPLLERMTEAGDKLAGEGLDEVRAARETLQEAKAQAEQLIAAAERAQGSLDRASDNVEVALARAEPLQGLTERIARLNERLPGGGRGNPG